MRAALAACAAIPRMPVLLSRPPSRPAAPPRVSSEAPRIDIDGSQTNRRRRGPRGCAVPERGGRRALRAERLVHRPAGDPACAARLGSRRDRGVPRRQLATDTAAAGAKYSDWRPGDGDGVRNNEFCSLQSDGVRELVMLPASRRHRRPAGPEPGACVSSTIRRSTSRPPRGEVGATAVGWHTDHSYWSTCTSTQHADRLDPAARPPRSERDALCRHRQPSLAGKRAPARLQRSRPRQHRAAHGASGPQGTDHADASSRRARSASTTCARCTRAPRTGRHLRASPWRCICRTPPTPSGSSLPPAGVEIVLPHDQLCRTRRPRRARLRRSCGLPRALARREATGHSMADRTRTAFAGRSRVGCWVAASATRLLSPGRLPRLRREHGRRGGPVMAVHGATGAVPRVALSRPAHRRRPQRREFGLRLHRADRARTR